VSTLGGESLSQEQIDALFKSLAAGNKKEPDPKPEPDAAKKEPAGDDK